MCASKHPAGLVVAALVVLVASACASSCSSAPLCPPATLATINAKYVADGAQACAGTPMADCKALDPVKAERLAEEKAAGCL